MDNLVLIGFMGTGKSTVGAFCARELGYTFRDSDVLIERDAGVSIPEIFAAEGEAGFRARERAIIASLTARGGQVIATGGGAILDPENASRLRATGCVVALQARPDTILKRVGDVRSRPLLASCPDPEARIADLLSERSAVYTREARCIFDTDNMKPKELAAAIAAWYKSSHER